MSPELRKQFLRASAVFWCFATIRGRPRTWSSDEAEFRPPVTAPVAGECTGLGEQYIRRLIAEVCVWVVLFGAYFRVARCFSPGRCASTDEEGLEQPALGPQESTFRSKVSAQGAREPDSYCLDRR